MQSYTVGPEAGMDTSTMALIWSQSLMNFHLTNNEILVPLNLTAIIEPSCIEQLKSQLSTYLGCPCVAFVDDSLGCVRILARPEFKGSGSVTDNTMQSRSSATGHFALNNDSPVECPENMDKKIRKREKAPRPPNAFILYRKHYHSIIKKEDPNLHNNDISVTIGAQWNNETDEVKNHFKQLAAEAKRIHAQMYPNYQYAPRKPCEKKRRKTRRLSEASDFDGSTDDEEEHPLQSPCESSLDSSPSTGISGLEHDDFADQTMEELMSFVAVPPPPSENYNFSDFGGPEYNGWVTGANRAQRTAAIAQYNARNQARNHLESRVLKPRTVRV